MWKACFFEVPLRTPNLATAGPDVYSCHSPTGGDGDNGGGNGGGDVIGGGGDGGDGVGGPDRRLSNRDGAGRSEVVNGRAEGNGGQEPDDETIEMTIQVWDEDEGVGAEFLGEVNFDAQALLDMARGRLKQVRIL